MNQVEEAVVRLLVVLVVAPHAQHHVETLAVQIWSITHTPVNRDVKELVCHLAKQDVSEDVNMEVDNQCEYIVSVYLHFFIM